jgi:hypothetical protein
MRTLLFVLLLAAASIAQTQPATSSGPLSVPLIEDRELYYAFFNYHQGLVNAMQAAKAANPQNSAQLDQQMATLLGVSVQELTTVIQNTAWFVQQCADMAVEQQARLASASANTGPSPSQLSAAFEFKRARITVEAVRLLNQKLSAASWAGLHAYITGTYKDTIYKH